MKETYTSKNQSKKVEELHSETQGWKSNLHFIEDETLFIDRLLSSYVFQPNTQNLFERLQNYQRQLKSLKNSKTQLKKRIAKHENNLGGMLECTDESCDFEYYQKHEVLKAEVVDHITRYKELKSEIFNYAGGILKKRKSVSNK